MLKITFQIGGDLIEAIIKGNELYFNDVSTKTMTSIEGIRISRAGVLKEHPDLKEDREWKTKAIERFKILYKSFDTEKEKEEYIIKELTKFGYKALMRQRAGFRPTKYR